MSKRKIKDLKGRDLRDFPEVELVTSETPRPGPQGIPIYDTYEIPVKPMPVIEGARAPEPRVQEDVKARPTMSATTGERAVRDARHVMTWVQGNTDKVIEGGRLAPHLTPSRATTAVVRNIGPAERRDMKRVMRFIDSLQLEEDADE